MAGVAEDLKALRLSASVIELSRARPTDCAPLVMDAVQAAAGRLGYDTMRLPSGAGHDAMYMAPTGPAGMIFILPERPQPLSGRADRAVATAGRHARAV